MIYALIYINNDVFSCLISMLAIFMFNLHVIIHQILFFFILDRVLKSPALVLGEDSPPRVTPHLVNPPIAITIWRG